MLKLYTAAEPNALLSALLQNHVLTQRSAFECSWIAVPNHATKQWLQQQMARTLGIAAGIEFLMPGSLIWRLLEVAKIDAVTTRSEDLLWLLAQQETLDLAGLQRHRHTADCLHRYLQQRPEWIARWQVDESPPTGHPRVWQHIAGQLPGRHAVDWLKRLQPESFKALPPMHLFATEQISQLLLEYLKKVSQVIDVFIYIHDPAPQAYWYKSRTVQQTPAQPALQETHPVDNALLAELGRSKALLLDHLIAIDHLQHEILPQDEAAPVSLLDSLKADTAACLEVPTSSALDDSVQVHACHNPRREIQVLKDRLLDVLSRCPDVRLQDVLLVAPDINVYVDAIQSVFAQAPALAHHIDRMRLADDAQVQALLQWLDSLDGDMPNHQGVELLELPAIRAGQQFSEDDTQRLRQWLQDVHVLWGFDAAFRGEQGAEAIASNTWRWGMDRWLQGHVAGDHEHARLLPAQGVLQGDEAVFARAFDFFSGWHRAAQQAAVARSPSAWHLWLMEQCDWLLGDMNEALRDSLHAALINSKQNPGVRLQLDALRQWLRWALSERRHRSAGVIGVRCQSWENANTLPARVLLICGLNDGVYPQAYTPDDADLCARRPQPLDVNPRLRDKGLLLTALTGAVEHLIVTHRHSDAINNTPLAPAQPLVHLLHTLQAKTNGQFSVQVHRMHAHHPMYYRGGDFHSFDARAHAVLLASQRPAVGTSVRWQRPEDAPQASVDLDWTDVQAFAKLPPVHYINQSLLARLDRPQDVLNAQEDYRIQGLRKWRMNQTLLRHPNDPQILHKAAHLVQNKTGRRLTRLHRSASAGLLEIHAGLRPLWVERRVDGALISGHVKVDAEGRVCAVELNDIKSKDVLRLWLDMLLAGGGRAGVLHAANRVVHLRAPGDADACVQPWLQRHIRSHTEPWFFIPEAALKANVTLAVKTRDEYRKNIISEKFQEYDVYKRLYVKECMEWPDMEADIAQFVEPIAAHQGRGEA